MNDILHFRIIEEIHADGSSRFLPQMDMGGGFRTLTVNSVPMQLYSLRDAHEMCQRQYEFTHGNTTVRTITHPFEPTPLPHPTPESEMG